MGAGKSSSCKKSYEEQAAEQPANSRSATDVVVSHIN
jgi:hypothetical protein